jgi:hypothetical protein
LTGGSFCNGRTAARAHGSEDFGRVIRPAPADALTGNAWIWQVGVPLQPRSRAENTHGRRARRPSVGTDLGGSARR